MYLLEVQQLRQARSRIAQSFSRYWAMLSSHLWGFRSKFVKVNLEIVDHIPCQIGAYVHEAPEFRQRDKHNSTETFVNREE